MTTGRINQVYTNVTVWRRRHGIHAHKPPATRHNFSDQRRRDEGCQEAAGPGEHPQTTHNQETRTVKTNPRSQEAGSNLNNPRRTNPSNSPRNRARKSKFASRGGPRQRTSCHDVPGSGSTAPLHQKATRTTARPPNSGATGKPATPTHIYKERAGDHAHDFEKKSVLISPWWKLVWRVRFLSHQVGKTQPPRAALPYLRDFVFLGSRGAFWMQFFVFFHKSIVVFKWILS